MSRPRKRRRVCKLPENNIFGPLHAPRSTETIVLSVDEFETLRLIDDEGLTQEECSKQMDVARTTVQSIYAEARRKTSHALVAGKNLLIEGGSYELCDGMTSYCNKAPCRRKGTSSRCRKAHTNENCPAHE